MTAVRSVGLTYEACLERVLDELRTLALELGGPRAVQAVSATASLERDVGLGSLERVQLLARLETALGRELGDRFLLLDTPAEIARAAVETGGPAPRELGRAPVVALPPARQAPEDAPTIHEVLRRRALAEGDRPHVYLYDPDRPVEEVSFGRLWTGAAAVARGLRERGVERGETVALVLPTGLDFLQSFQGILIAGAVPVPLYPPARLDQLEEYLVRQTKILANARARCLITIPQAMPIAGMLKKSAPSLREVTAPHELVQSAPDGGAGATGAGDAALIQYTSGSTGDPRGVLLTHANLIANIRAAATAIALEPTDVGVSWLPLYHDMGLIGSWLFCLYHGIPLALMSPLAFLARPERWLWAIHERRATLSAAPNFAYELCARRIPDRALEGLDLSSWRCAANGSEPVSWDTLDRFTRRFGRHGFRREAILPVYGLAECAAGLCVPPVGRGPLLDRVARLPYERDGHATPASPEERSPLRFVSVGAPLPAHEVRICDSAGNDVPDRVVGRLLFRGPSAMAGYYENPAATAAVTHPGGWLDSGDLAYRAGGELYITGRVKDIIIKGGRNLIPQEIEEITASVEGVRKGCVVAFGVTDPTLGTEALVVVAETRVAEPEARAQLEAAIVARLAAEVGMPPDRVVLAPARAVPKTPSGKPRRGATRDLYLARKLGAEPRLALGRRLALVRGAAATALRPWLARAGRALYATYFVTAAALVVLPVGLVCWALVAVLPGRGPAFALERVIARVLLGVAGCRLSVEGLEHLRGKGPFVLAANHSSYADTLALIALLPVRFVFVAKAEVLSWPLVGTFVRKAQHPTVQRWDATQSVADTERVTRILGAGESLVFFPEGTFTAVTGLRPFRLGAFQTAAESNSPVVPLALRGTRRVLRDGTWLPRPGPIHLWVGPPITPEGRAWHTVIDLRNRIADAIAAHCGEPRLDLVAAGPPQPT
jgi:1-acyl-sn-glycerol-3-phosphate acyltransferase